ncbi:hypothetical protein MJO29_013194 [Puccinia striiformis f. sp. tritici]|uniref:Uncharacterized protein n=1 Tax=Puccinia striiformis f. sp. tritici PST-78 TaxID=1165861 RepID=A0A0L0URT1_9BASI|nr:hypothetical protein MJO29_013194 [Puccinia striiformis f. sp. tritici]KNE89601.1 hypothetical protein PSTG_16939 [Puccinia striiformis f. sp. tritici PST-78]
MSTVSSSGSTVSFTFSPDISSSTLTSNNSHLAVPSQLVQPKQESKAGCRAPSLLQKPLAPKLVKRTAGPPIIQRDWSQEAEIGLILYLAGTSSASVEEQSASLRQYSLALEASTYAEENHRMVAHTKRSTVLLIKSIKKWWSYNKLDSYHNQARPITMDVASVHY